MKKCSTCGFEKELSEFTNKKTAKDGKSSNCRECSRQVVRNHYANNKDYYLKKNREQGERNRERLWEHLKACSCKDCGETNPLFLEFDHIADDKFKNVAELTMRWPWTTIQKEIDKCEVVCLKCHRLRTYKRANFWQYRKWLETQ